MSAIPAKLQRFLDGLALVTDRGERISLLIGLADRFREVPESIARRPFPADHQAPHCESEAYLWAEPQPDGTLKFHFAVENPQGISAKAMAVILDETLSGAPLAEVVAVPQDLPYTIFGRELSMGKSMGLIGLMSMVQVSARRHLAQRQAAQPAPGRRGGEEAPSGPSPGQRK